MKKVLFFIITNLLVMSANSQNVLTPYANAGQKTMVDISRIIEGYEPEARITFKVGELNFEGTIENTKAPYTESEISRIIKETMREYNLNEADLWSTYRQLAEYEHIGDLPWKEIIPKALDIMLSNGLNPHAEKYKAVRDIVLTGREVASHGNIWDVMNPETPSFERMFSVTNEIYSLKPIQNAASNAVKTHYGLEAAKMFGKANRLLAIGLMALAAIDLGMDLYKLNEQYHITDHADYVSKMMELQMKLEFFYLACRMKLFDELEKYYANGQWHIKVSEQYTILREGVKLLDFTPLDQVWFMKADLVLVEPEVKSQFDENGIPRNLIWAGQYEGSMSITATHSEKRTKDFDDHFDQNVLLNPQFMFHLFSPMMDVEDKTVERMVLGDKVLESNQVRLKLKKGEKERTVRFIGQLDEKVPKFNVNHSSQFLLNRPLYKKGNIKFFGAQGEVKVKFEFYGMPEGNNGRYLALYVISQENKDYLEVILPFFGTKRYDYENTVLDIVTDGRSKIREDRNIFAPLEKECGYVITKVNTYEKFTNTSEHANRPSSGKKKSKSLTNTVSPTVKPEPTVSIKAEPLADENNGVWTRDWKSEHTELLGKGEQFVKSGKLPEAYDFLMPEGLKNTDVVVVKDRMMSLLFQPRDGVDFNKLVQRLKNRGFRAESLVENVQFDGKDNQGRECLVCYTASNNFLLVQIQKKDEKESEAEQTASKIERLTKRMEEINKEIQAHPEKAVELQEEILDISIELQEESLKIQEKMLEQ